MKNIIKLITLSFLSILTFACEDQSIETIETKTAVVTGYLYAGQPVDSLKIVQSFSYTQSETDIVYLDDLEVSLSDLTTTYPLTSIGNGFYENTALLIAQDKTYQLEFEWQGDLISAETYVPLKTEAAISVSEVEVEKIEIGTGMMGPPMTEEIDPVEITWDNTNGDYYYIVITNIEDDPEYVNENIAPTQGDDNRFVFITEPQITDSYPIDARRELSQYGTHQVVVFRVNPEYAALYESSGNSTLSLEQPPTNITNGLGIFTGVSSDTLYLEVTGN